MIFDFYTLHFFMSLSANQIFSVGEFISFLNIGLKKSKAKIIGEVVEVNKGPTGHLYFTLKDEKSQGSLSCIIWKQTFNLYGIELKKGMKVILFGNANVYAPSGRLSFVAETIELVGEGELKKQYEELKKKLQEEGIFDLDRKRAIPKYPQKIGVITAKQGAVISDFLNNLGQFGYKIKMIDSRVEGQEAVKDLLSAIKRFKKIEIDLLVIIRGGGSLESLMAFNNEFLVREVVNFPVPVIVGIGHDKDIPLVTLAADISESTPTAVANLINKSWEQLAVYLERKEREIIIHYEIILRYYKDIENRLAISFNIYKNSLLRTDDKLKIFLSKSLSGFELSLLAAKSKLRQIEKIITLNNPESQLRLGYSITTYNGKIVRKISDVSVGKEVSTKLLDGKINSKILKINKR